MKLTGVAAELIYKVLRGLVWVLTLGFYKRKAGKVDRLEDELNMHHALRMELTKIRAKRRGEDVKEIGESTVDTLNRLGNKYPSLQDNNTDDNNT